MAIQLKSDELKGCESYFEWLIGLLEDENDEFSEVRRAINREFNGFFGDETENLSENDAPDDLKEEFLREKLRKNGVDSELGSVNDKFGSQCADIPLSRFKENGQVRLLRYLFERDFWVFDGEDDADERFGCPEDLTQGANGMELRRRYAEFVGKLAKKSERDIDRIWKTIHGKCSVLELLVHLCIKLDEMTNEDESGTTVGRFFELLLGNLEFDITAEIDDWDAILERFLGRKYAENGSGGGLFPLKNPQKDQRKVPIWFQLNAWLNENLDENAGFKW